MLTDKQKKILSWFKENEILTKKDAVKLIGGYYYCNGSKHTGDVLTRMVKSGLLVRTKIGSYVKGVGKRNTVFETENPNQNYLFDTIS